MARHHLAEMTPPIEALALATDAAGRTGAYISLVNAGRAYVVFHITQANAATVALSLKQAKSAGAGSAKAITATMPIWATLDCATSDALVRQSDAASFTTDAATKHKIVVFQVDPEKVLDIANGFDYVAPVTGASDVANLTSALVIPTDLRYQQVTPPTAIA